MRIVERRAYVADHEAVAVNIDAIHACTGSTSRLKGSGKRAVTATTPEIGLQCTCSTMPPLSPKSTSKSNESGSITAFFALQTGVVARWNPGGGARHAATAMALLIATLIFLKSSRDAKVNQGARCFGV